MSSADRGGAHHPVVELTLTRVREFIREPEALFWTFVFPIVMSLVMAMAFPSRGAQPVPVGVAAGEARASIREALAKAPGIALKDIPPGAEQRALREGEVHVIVVPTRPPTYRFDPARGESRTARLAVDDALKRAAGRVDPWVAREEPVAIPGSRYVDWLIPGLVAMGIMSNGMWGVAFSIVQARMRKLLKRMVASPMQKREYLFAHLLARLLFLAPEVGVPLGFGVVAFGMPVNGSIAAIAGVTLLGSLAFSTFGLLLATRARTFEAVSGLMNMAMLPMWLLSGVFFSSSNFPRAVQPAIQALPLTALVDALRAVVLEGATLPAVHRQLFVLACWTVIPFAMALRLFRWR
jgi:ABC-2 type transport system permease protein